MMFFLKTVLEIFVKIHPKILLDFYWVILDSSESKFAVLYRGFYLMKYCEKTGENVFVGKNVNLKNIEKLSLGSNVSIHSFTYIDAYGKIVIGNNVSIANHCSLISSDHTWEDSAVSIKFNKVVKKPIDIKDDIWIASGCRVLGDVTIEERTVVGAGTVVNKSLEANSLYVGVPARKVKNINEVKSNE